MKRLWFAILLAALPLALAGCIQVTIQQPGSSESASVASASAEATDASASSASAAATVAVGGSVTITITPSPDGNAATGYIITRSAKDGDKVMEMVSISAKKTEPVTYEDVNADLPGTASIVLLSDRTQEASANLSFVQFMSLSTVPLPRDKAFTHPFGVTLFGALEHKTPEFDALIENVGYRGGLY